MRSLSVDKENFLYQIKMLLEKWVLSKTRCLCRLHQTIACFGQYPLRNKIKVLKASILRHALENNQTY